MGTSMYFIGDRAMFLQYPTVTFIFSVVSGLISLTEVNHVYFSSKTSGLAARLWNGRLFY